MKLPNKHFHKGETLMSSLMALRSESNSKIKINNPQYELLYQCGG